MNNSALVLISESPKATTYHHSRFCGPLQRTHPGGFGLTSTTITAAKARGLGPCRQCQRMASGEQELDG